MKWIRITLCGAVMLLGMLIWLQAQFAGAHSKITLERHTEVVDKIEAQLADGISETDRIHLQGPSDFVSEVLARNERHCLGGLGCQLPWAAPADCRSHTKEEGIQNLGVYVAITPKLKVDVRRKK